MNPYPHLEKLLLASGSPRRAELLRALGLVFEIRAPNIDESHRANELPRDFAERLAREKAAAARTDERTTVLAADTIVVLDERVLGKPADENEARETLAALSGRSHDVITGVCLRRGKHARVFSATTRVEFGVLTPAEIDAYVATGDPMDKAGSYAIQGGAAAMVRAIDGSYTNVVGLPLRETHEALISF